MGQAASGDAGVNRTAPRPAAVSPSCNRVSPPAPATRIHALEFHYFVSQAGRRIVGYCTIPRQVDNAMGLSWVPQGKGIQGEPTMILPSFIPHGSLFGSVAMARGSSCCRR